jgi:bifunctional NMN adenylyltransferase/nudix hydrolase
MKIAHVIGRFQPFHNEHLALVRFAIELADMVIIAIGDTGVCRSFKNPWTYEERVAMILGSLNATEKLKVRFFYQEDQPYDDAAWVSSLKQSAKTFWPEELLNHQVKPLLVGFRKDASSYYLDLFPEWEKIEMNGKSGLSATDIRNRFFLETPNFPEWPDVPESVAAQMQTMPITRYLRMREEGEAILRHNKRWQSFEGATYGVQHVTADVFLERAEHVLLIRRRGKIGYGTWALPGGFVEAHERVRDTAVRELFEETGIQLPPESHRGLPMYTFDSPGRSQNGRIFTHVLRVEIMEHETFALEPHAGDDALEAAWFPKKELLTMKPNFFADHFHIITSLISD